MARRAGWATASARRVALRCSRFGARLRRFQFFELQFQLLDLAIHLLRLAPELHAAQLGDQQLQMLDLGVARGQLLVLRMDSFFLRSECLCCARISAFSAGIECFEIGESAKPRESCSEYTAVCSLQPD